MTKKQEYLESWKNCKFQSCKGVRSNLGMIVESGVKFLFKKLFNLKIIINKKGFDFAYDNKKFEIKSATLNSKNFIVFKGIVVEEKFDYLLCFGIFCNEIKYFIQTKKEFLKTNKQKPIYKTKRVDKQMSFKNENWLTFSNFIKKLSKIIKIEIIIKLGNFESRFNDFIIRESRKHPQKVSSYETGNVGVESLINELNKLKIKNRICSKNYSLFGENHDLDIFYKKEKKLKIEIKTANINKDERFKFQDIGFTNYYSFNILFLIGIFKKRKKFLLINRESEKFKEKIKKTMNYKINKKQNKKEKSNHFSFSFSVNSKHFQKLTSKNLKKSLDKIIE